MDLAHILLILVILVVLAAAAVVTLLICAMAFVMVMITVLAISAIVGFTSGKVLSGVRALFVQLGILAGAPVGGLAAVLFTEFWPGISHHGVILVMGGATGAFGGLIVALLACYAAQLAADRFPRLGLPRTTLVSSS